MNFNVPFSRPPAVTAGFTELDVLDGANLRLTFEVNVVDERGFNYTLVTWADTRVYSADVTWMAVGGYPSGVSLE